MSARVRLSARTSHRDPFTCLRCGYVFDAATGVGEEPPAERPKAGSISLCIRCGDVAIFLDAPPWLRAPSPDERRACDADPDMQRIRAILAQLIAERAPS